MNNITNCHLENTVDESGNPTGGHVIGTGVNIQWQDGPLGRHSPTCSPGKPCTVDSGCTRRDPNGAFVETVISAALQRIEFYQKAYNGKFACRENALAMTKLEEALHWLESRTSRRERQNVEGTHQGN